MNEDNDDTDNDSTDERMKCVLESCNTSYMFIMYNVRRQKKMNLKHEMPVYLRGFLVISDSSYEMKPSRC
jgi:hypothetical protein